MKEQTKNAIKRTTINIGEGLLRSSVNALLYFFFLSMPVVGEGGATSRGAYRMFQNADSALEEINYDTFKHMLSSLSKKGLVKRPRSGRTHLDIEITQEGKKRLHSVLPVYLEKRPWDGHLYIISYDIAESHHKKRDLFRRFLLRIGCALLQESLWVTPYNPRDLVEAFVESHGAKGTVIISRLGTDGAIGEEDVHSLVSRIYKLSDLNDRYRDFLKVAEDNRESVFSLGVRFLGILKDDPQLPFALLPSDWPGDKAYRLYLNRVQLQSRPRP